MDIIKQSAIKFKSLLNIEYKIVLGRKSQTTILYLCFDKACFFHLLGLQYIKDVNQLKKRRDLVFDEILSSDLSSKIIKSAHYKEIEDRVNAFINFQQYLDSDNVIFKYNKHASSMKYSKIKFDFLAVNTEHHNNIFTFFKKETSDTNSIIPVSFFPKENNDYCIGQTRMTLLLKEKINTKSNIKKVLFCHKNYSTPEFDK